MTHPFTEIDQGPFDDDTERFYCGCCDVVFKEPFPEYHDVTPCLGCDCKALNIRYAIPPTEEELNELIERLTNNDS